MHCRFVWTTALLHTYQCCSLSLKIIFVTLNTERMLKRAGTNEVALLFTIFDFLYVFVHWLLFIVLFKRLGLNGLFHMDYFCNVFKTFFWSLKMLIFFWQLDNNNENIKTIFMFWREKSIRYWNDMTLPFNKTGALYLPCRSRVSGAGAVSHMRVSRVTWTLGTLGSAKQTKQISTWVISISKFILVNGREFTT